MLTRRSLLLAASAGMSPLASRADVVYPNVVPRPLVFPRDHGAHPDYRTEWWYLTGWLNASPQPLGFQVTFFRVRTSIDPANPSAFAAHQLIVAHAAISDSTRGALLIDQAIARTGFGVSEAATEDTAIKLGLWSLTRNRDSGAYRAVIAAREFNLRFVAQTTQPILLQGTDGYSRKGPSPEQASYYYSQVQLRIEAELAIGGGTRKLAGTAWLDHEWSSSFLPREAAGWDWLAMNLDNGDALTAFQIRSQDTAAVDAPLWAYGALRTADGRAQIFQPRDIHFERIAQWTSPRTRATWPVAQRIRLGDRTFETRPLMQDQELDSRATTGAVYWEGASTLIENDKAVGRGYLEMTGYVAPMKL